MSTRPTVLSTPAATVGATAAVELTVLVARLDLAAKVRLLTGASPFVLAAEPAVGLRPVATSDGPLGVRGLTVLEGDVTALLPDATLQAATWDPAVAAEVGAVLADEARRLGVQVVLGPTVNLHRSPLGGRLFECFSEDPLLSGVMAAATIRAMQAGGVAAVVKHLAANEAETDRDTVDNRVSESALRETYLLPFEIAVTDGGVWAVMAAYNRVNGESATESRHLLTDVLRRDWGFDGLVVSDWSATRSTAAAGAGLDLVMPGPRGPWGEALAEDVRSGRLPEQVVDEHVRRVLQLARRVGALESAPAGRGVPPGPASLERRGQLTRLAARGMTVLTNRGAVLPLAGQGRIALVGRHALETVGMGGGAAHVTPPHVVSVADALRTRLGELVTVTDGVAVRSTPAPADRGLVTTGAGSPGLDLTVLDADGAVLQSAAGVTSLVPGGDDALPRPPARVLLRGRLVVGGELRVGTLGAGNWRVRVGEYTWTHAVAPSTTLAADFLAPPAWTTDARLEAGAEVDIEVELGEPDAAGMSPKIGFIAEPAARPVAQVLADAASAARCADVAVVVVGLTDAEECESVDKSTLALPGHQDALVHAVAAAATRTVVVLNAATPVLMPWLDEVDAVLVAGLPGQEAGAAVAAALLGDVEPAGRLVTTIPASDGATPAWSVTPVDGQVVYREGSAVGYRGHVAGLAPEPAFWFGHGLGYGSWEWSDPEATARPGRPPAVSVLVRNTSGRTSREVVQVYLRPVEADQPVRLVGWAGVEVPAGESARVVVEPDARVWRRWDDATGRWAPLAAGGRLLLARGLGDVRVELAVPDGVTVPVG